MPPLVDFLGRLHPMVLHAPIGILIGLVSLEAIGAVRRKPVPSEVRGALAWLLALSALAAGVSGFVLGQSSEFSGELVDLHRILGIAGAIACVVVAVVLQRAGARAAYFATLAVATGVIVVAGHKGAGITHGENFLFEPFEARSRPAPESNAPTDSNAKSPTESAASTQPATPQSDFVRIVQPILEQRCYACHGPQKKKGGLDLHTPEGIFRGGDFGPIVIAGHPESSEIVRRLRLDPDDDDHMPPSGKTPLTAEQTKAIEDWIAAGAAMDAPGQGESTAPASVAEATPVPPVPSGPPVPDGRAVEELRARLVHVAPVSAGSHLLSIDLGVAPGLSEADAVALLTPLKQNIEELAAPRAHVGDALAALCAEMPGLRKLDLSGTALTDAGVKSLAEKSAVEDLVLTRLHLTDASAQAIGSITSLKTVYLWNSGLTREAIDSVRAARTDLSVDFGDSALAAAVEQETEVKLSSEAPAPGAAPPIAADALKPVNATCPVSGKPIDPEFLLVHKGRVIGFCCRVCLNKFLDDPSQFESKLQ